MILNLVVTNVYVYLSKEKKVYVEGVGEKLWSYMVELEGGEKKEKKKTWNIIKLQVTWLESEFSNKFTVLLGVLVWYMCLNCTVILSILEHR